MIKAWIRRLVPESAISAYHLWLARAAAVAYGHPSEQLIVVGVTGTNGKSSTVQYIGRILEHAGFRAGWTTTVGFKVGPHEWVNDKKMTMLGRFATQRLLREMVRAGCTHAIIETSSQGILQHRHAGIHYDVAVFTNLTPEHIEAHGGFDRYKATKGRLFAELATAKEKVIDGRGVQKASVVNGLDEHAEYFLSFRAGVPFVFGKNAKDVRITKDGTVFTLEGVPFSFKPVGRFNYENVLAAIMACRSLGMPLGEIAEAVAALEPVPGRLEVMDVGQSFAVVVDYAYEPASLAAVYEAIKLFGYARLIHVTGSAGGGRDVARRAIIGQMAAQHDDIVVVTNEDPYDDDPMQIINDVADAAAAHGKRDGVDLWRIEDRQEAINRALSLAQPGDLVLITGKGCEPVMAVADGRKIPWDDRAAVRQALGERQSDRV